MRYIVYDLNSVGPLEFKFVAPMPEQLKTTAMHFYCCGPDFFGDEIKILGPQIVGYYIF